jgi:hypothetical protein
MSGDWLNIVKDQELVEKQYRVNLKFQWNT